MKFKSKLLENRPLFLALMERLRILIEEDRRSHNRACPNHRYRNALEEGLRNIHNVADLQHSPIPNQIATLIFNSIPGSSGPEEGMFYDIYAQELCDPETTWEKKYMMEFIRPNPQALLELNLMLNENNIDQILDVAREQILDDQDRHEELRRVCQIMDIPCDDVVSQCIINEVVEVKSNGYTEEYRRHYNNIPQDNEIYIQYHDQESIKPLQVDPITNRIIIDCVPKPELTEKLNDAVVKLAADVNYFKNHPEELAKRQKVLHDFGK